MLAIDPNATPRRTDRKPCPHCDASAAGCRSVAWLRGSPCCESCPSDHDAGTEPQEVPC